MEKGLPENWIELQLRELLQVFENGSRPKGGVQGILEGIPSLGGEHLTSEGGFKFDKLKFIPVTFAAKMKRGLIKERDILIVKDGATTGKTSFVNDTFPFNQAYVNEHVFICRPYSVLNQKMIFYFLFSKEGQERILNNFTGSAQGGINQKFASNTLIPIPPLPEQNRIVAKLDKLFGQLEEINERVRSLREIKEKFTYSCLISTDTGQFFTRQKIGRYLEEGKERIGENWPQYRKIGVSAKKGIIDLSTGQKKSFETYKVVKPGDFIYNTMRVNIGSIAIYTGKEIAITSPDYVVFRVKDFLSSELLLGFLKSDQGLLEIGANTKGSVRARLYFKSLSEIRMPVSDQKTQILAEKFLTTYSHSLRKLKKISKTKLIDLEKSILNKAFKGELVPQLESDGDARELLEEINNNTDNLVKKASARKKTMKNFSKNFSQECPAEQENISTAAEGGSSYSNKNR